MKSNRGITLLSLVIYIIVLSIVVGTMSLMVNNFYKNVDDVDISKGLTEQYTRFVAYISEDINSRKN